MTSPDSDELPPELLAAYADGELDESMRAAVERWLAAHPEARAELEDQRELSPANAELWDRAEPPEPSAVAWASVRRGIAGELAAAGRDRPGRGRLRVAALAFGGLAAAGAAAAAVWLAFGPVAPPAAVDTPAPVEVVKTPPEVAPAPRPVRPAPPRTVAGFAVLPMADDDDVILERVPNTRAGWLPVGRHPMPEVLLLASVEEVHLEGVDPSPAWPPGGPRMTTGPGDVPMIFAAKPR
jgi:hypothetical protein